MVPPLGQEKVSPQLRTGSIPTSETDEKIGKISASFFGTRLLVTGGGVGGLAGLIFTSSIFGAAFIPLAIGGLGGVIIGVTIQLVYGIASKALTRNVIADVDNLKITDSQEDLKQKNDTAVKNKLELRIERRKTKAERRKTKAEIRDKKKKLKKEKDHVDRIERMELVDRQISVCYEKVMLLLLELEAESRMEKAEPVSSLTVPGAIPYKLGEIGVGYCSVYGSYGDGKMRNMEMPGFLMLMSLLGQRCLTHKITFCRGKNILETAEDLSQPLYKQDKDNRIISYSDQMDEVRTQFTEKNKTDLAIISKFFEHLLHLYNHDGEHSVESCKQKKCVCELDEKDQDAIGVAIENILAGDALQDDQGLVNFFEAVRKEYNATFGIKDAPPQKSACNI